MQLSSVLMPRQRFLVVYIPFYRLSVEKLSVVKGQKMPHKIPASYCTVHYNDMLNVVSVQKLQSSNVEYKINKGETCPNKPKMIRRLDEVRLDDDGHQCTSFNYFPGNSMIDRNERGVCSAAEQEKQRYFRARGPELVGSESMYHSNTVHLTNDVKEKLSWIRCKEYSPYGEELLKTNKIKSIENELLTVATYNILSQELLEKHFYLYSNHDHRSLDWNTRSRIILEELELLNADLLCLQEVDSRLFDPFFNSHLNKKGYEGIFKRRTHGKTDGCAIYFKKDKFNLVESITVEFFKESIRLLNRDNIGLILKLSLKERPNAELVLATTHLLYNPRRSDVRLAQTQVMLAEIERLAYKRTDPETGLPEYLPILFTGDMNYSPDSAVYQLVTKSRFEYEGMSRNYLTPFNDGPVLNKTLLPAAVGVTDSCQYASTLSNRSGDVQMEFESGTLGHNLNLASVYNHVKGDLPEATTNQDKWLTVDYIFYSQVLGTMNARIDGGLKLIWKLTLPNSAEAEAELINIPNLGCGSDHLPLLAMFHLLAP